MANVNWEKIRKMAHEEFGDKEHPIIIDDTVDMVRMKGWNKFTMGPITVYLKANSAWDMVQVLLGRKEVPHEVIYDEEVGH